MSRVVHYNHLTHSYDWYDGSDLPAEIIHKSMCPLTGRVPAFAIFYWQDLRKQRLEAKKSQKENPA